jgi:hypothetical protein
MGIWSNVFIVVRSKLVLKTKTNWTSICLQFEIKSVNLYFLDVYEVWHLIAHSLNLYQFEHFCVKGFTTE